MRRKQKKAPPEPHYDKKTEKGPKPTMIRKQRGGLIVPPTSDISRTERARCKKKYRKADTVITKGRQGPPNSHYDKQ
jgi:hypothetical protein